jgi:hypothetical protein
LIATALLAWVAAPALSLQPWAPAAVDFEQRLPDAERIPAAQRSAAHPGEAAARWISPAIEAPHRFDLVGIAGEMRPVEIRARPDDGAWSEWVETGDGTPVYVDGADHVQVRAPFRPSGDLHYVNVSGTAGGALADALNSVRGSINSAFISLASTSVAQALAPKPKVISRAGWGADLAEGGCPPRKPAAFGAVRAAVIHHTVNANDYAPEEAPGIVLGICRFHVFGNGWDDIGYNALVDRYGVVYEGRAGGLKRPLVGAQAQGFNDQTTSIASIGDHSAEAITGQARRSIIRYLAWKLGVNRAKPANGTVQLTSGGGTENRHPAGTVITVPRIIGHLTLGNTGCPGVLDAEIPVIRNAVQKRMKRYSKRKGKKKKKKKGKKKRRAGGVRAAS